MVSLAVVGTGVGVGLYEYSKHKMTRQRFEFSQEDGDYSGTTTIISGEGKLQKRIILADLIRGMYDRERDKPQHDHCWRKHGYKFIPTQELLRDEDRVGCRDYLKDERKNKYFGVLQKMKSTPSNDQGPEWVVAIRGTNVRKWHDLRNDLKIFLEKLHTSSTVKLLMIVILGMLRNIVCNKVAITGHSLGAAKAMLVARNLALEGYAARFDCHFFNPPFATLPTIADKCIAELLASILDNSEANKGANVRDRLSIAMNFIADDFERMQKLLNEYRKLKNWRPTLYLNEHDLICLLYISHFIKRPGHRACSGSTSVHDHVIMDNDFNRYYGQVLPELKRKLEHHQEIQDLDSWYSFGSALLQLLLGEPQTFHLMPCATCCINGLNVARHLRPISAHSLDRWTRPDLAVTVRDAERVVELDEGAGKLTLKVRLDGIGSETGDSHEEENGNLENDKWRELIEKLLGKKNIDADQEITYDH
ncbi:hypothetical protein R1flu_006600 [Riccia fluitans]|uniref:Fungal lipase-type domain-containing protein n=1 Tax=Riccia fluitans TaxID=41844 RepID=A0ABD1YX46_9MARC